MIKFTVGSLNIKMKSGKRIFPPKPFLISPLHDPEGAYLSILKSAPNLKVYYSSVIIGATNHTNPRVISRLKKIGFNVFQGDLPYGQARLAGLRLGLEKKGVFFHLSDFDRILHWVDYHPQELKTVLGRAGSLPCLIVGRSRKAFAAHPSSWKSTEKIYNRLASKALGKKVDIGAGSIILNQEAAKIIIKKSKERGMTVIAEWPLLIKKAGLKIDYIPADGNAWEDPDRHQKEINKIGFHRWRRKYDSLEEWQKRIIILNEISSLIFNFSG